MAQASRPKPKVRGQIAAKHGFKPKKGSACSCLQAHYKIGQDQGNRRIGTHPNQGREPPLVWSVEFLKKVHIASNDTAPLVFPLCQGCALKPLRPKPTPFDIVSVRPPQFALN